MFDQTQTSSLIFQEYTQIKLLPNYMRFELK